MNFWDEREAKEFYQGLPFYNVLIEKAKNKHLKNIDLLHEIQFYNESRIKQISEAFK